MKRRVMLCLAALAVGGCASFSQTVEQRTPPQLLARAADAMGGEKLAGVRTLLVRASIRQWEPEQSVVPGGEMRLAADSTFEALTDVAARRVRIDWDRDMKYPAPRQYKFTEIITDRGGYVLGVDSTGRNKQSLETKPSAYAMSSLRVAAALREITRQSPLLVSEMRANPERVTASASIGMGGLLFPAVDYAVGDQKLTVVFDGGTGLPSRIRSLDYDNMWGDVTFDLVLGDWKVFDGVRVATQQRYMLNGRTIAEVNVHSVTVNPQIAADRFEVPEAIAASAKPPATGKVPYQWIIRRQYIGTYLDSESVSFDTQATQSLRLQDLAPGVVHVVGGTHNSLVVEMADHLVVVDAPVTDWQSAWTLNALKEKFPGKPVRYLVLTHHHMDHAGGMRAYAVAGATIVAGKGNLAHLRNLLAQPFSRNPDVPARNLAGTSIIEVLDRHLLSDGKREVNVYLTENPHADGMLIAFVPDAQLGYVTDLWSPGRDQLGRVLTPGQAAVTAFVKKTGIAPARFAGGHGTTGEYKPLADLETKKP